MATCQLSPVIEQLRRSTLIRDGAGLTDGQLLSRFIEGEDEAAFEALVRRHGPMVLGVSRRLLHNHHDAEDAFQATFLVLLRRAESIAPQEKLANWLYGVAFRTALKAKAIKFKRTIHEQRVISEPEAPSSPDVWDELRPVLDRELSGLPDKYRLPIVLCDLEGQSIKEAARNLDCPQGTLAGRLARARALLAKRVARYGPAISAGTLIALLSTPGAKASVPASFILSTVRMAGLGAAAPAAAGPISAQVAALTKGVLKTMLLSKLKIATAIFLTLGMIGLGGGAISYSLVVGEEPKAQQETPAVANKPVDTGVTKEKAAQTDKEKLQGTWKLVRLEAFGKVFGADKMTEVGDLTFDGSHLRCYQPYSVVPKQCVLQTVASNGGSYTMFHFRWHGTFELGESRNPKRIAITDAAPDGERWSYGIYSLDGDDLRICLCEGHDQIPNYFKTEEIGSSVCFTFRREKSTTISKTGAFQDPDNDQSGEIDEKTKEDPLMPKKAASGEDEKRWKQYHVECMLVKVDPQGKDFGEDGKGKVLSSPYLVVRENEEHRIHSGGSQIVHEDQQHICFLEFGIMARFKVYGLGGGTIPKAYESGQMIYVEANMEEIDIDKMGNKETQARGRFVRTIATPKLGESVKLVEKDERGEPRHWLRIKVVKEETVTLGRAYTEPAYQGK